MTCRCARLHTFWALGLLVAPACQKLPTAITVVLVDGSASRVAVEDYVRGWQQVVESTQPGDRLVLGRIRSDTVGFRPDFDESLPQISLMFDNVLERAKRRAAFLARARAGMTHALGQKPLMRTPILDSLSAAEPIFVSASQTRRRLVIFSDMLEDSENARFVQMNQINAQRVIASLRSDHALPNLANVEVFVVGVSAPNNHQLRRVAGFWRRYFHATGANLADGHYGSVLLGWPRR